MALACVLFMAYLGSWRRSYNLRVAVGRALTFVLAAAHQLHVAVIVFAAALPHLTHAVALLYRAMLLVMVCEAALCSCAPVCPCCFRGVCFRISHVALCCFPPALLCACVVESVFFAVGDCSFLLI